ncbi:FkbM family methyltransferase [Pseudomonas alvandae]|uniref:FkbM family methyltransferase n=1 Tax=Pseudomonas canavaninivorans TaxID=2842348 RepID=UPI00215E6B00|nr:FkbM family methyltransferase [Pseudomonas canavaninivorans]UVM71664.1 FkbM family methyltransferase [Pseudomonas canavaninivorans]
MKRGTLPEAKKHLYFMNYPTRNEGNDLAGNRIKMLIKGMSNIARIALRGWDAINKIDLSVRQIDRKLNEICSSLPNGHSVSYLGRDLCLVRTRWGGYVVVPSYNVDVAVGIIRDGVHEPWTTRLVQETLKLGDTYVNVGSNFGYYTSLGGLIVGNKGKVLSFEANPAVFAILLKTIMYAGIPDRTTVFNRAVFRETGEHFNFTFDYQFAGGGHLELNAIEQPCMGDPFWSKDSVPSILGHNGQWLPGKGIMNKFEAKTLALDDVIGEGPVDLLHCDVEAAEPYVITGAKTMIRNSPRLKIIFEWSSYSFDHGTDEYREAVNDMWTLLVSEGFSIRRLMPFLHADGAIELSERLTYAEFIAGEHGDYFAERSLQQ